MFIFKNGNSNLSVKNLLAAAKKFPNKKGIEIINFNTFNPSMTFSFLNKFSFKHFSRNLNKPKGDKDSDLTPTPAKLIKRKRMSDLDVEAFREEIRFLMENENYKEAAEKIEKMLNYYLTCGRDDDTLENIWGMTTLLSEALRESDLFEDSVAKKKFVLKHLENANSDKAHQVKIKTLDEIAFDYATMDNLEESLKYSDQIIGMIEERIKEDRVSLIEDKCSLVLNTMNMINIKSELGRPHKEILEDLNKCHQIFLEYKNKLDVLIGFKLFRQLGMVHFDLNNFKEAIKFLEESLKYKRMEGSDEDNDCYLVIKCLAECHLETNKKNTALELFENCITLKENIIKNSSPTELHEEGGQHYIDIARIYEILGEEYLEVNTNISAAEGLIQKAVDNYLKFPNEPIFLAKCYFMLAEIYLEQKEYLKSAEYAKKYIFAIEKFLIEHEKEFKEEDFDLEYYTRVDLTTHQSLIYKAFKYLATAYFHLNDKENCKKFGIMAVGKLIEINKADDADVNNDSENDLDFTDFLNMKYEIIKLYEMMGNDSLALKEYDEILTQLKCISVNKIQTVLDDNSSNSYIDKMYFVVDALYGKSDILIKMEKFEEAKKILGEVQDLILKNKLEVEDERLHEINNKVNLINIKLRLKSKDNEAKKSTHSSSISENK